MFINRAVKNASLLGLLPKRSVQTVTGKNYVVPEGEGINDMIHYLDNKRPTFTLLYFTAAWNPMCAKIEKDYENLTASHAQWHHIRVDCDKSPMIKQYFDARVEPQFLMLLNGGEI